MITAAITITICGILFRRIGLKPQTVWRIAFTIFLMHVFLAWDYRYNFQLQPIVIGNAIVLAGYLIIWRWTKLLHRGYRAFDDEPYESGRGIFN